MKESFVAFGNVYYVYSLDAGVGFVSNSDGLDAVTPSGEIIRAGLAGERSVNGAEIFTIIDKVFSEGPFLNHRNAETGANILFVRLGESQFGKIACDVVVFDNLPLLIRNDDIMRVETNARRTIVNDGISTTSGVTQISGLSLFDGALYFSADTFGPGGLGKELYKFENSVVSLAFNLTPGQSGNGIGRSMGVFDAGDEGGTPIFSSTHIGGNPNDDVLDSTDGDDELSGLGGDDVINGNNGDDILNGNEGDDRLTGGRCVDTLRGGDGVDVLTSGSGDGQFTGGAGSAKHVAGSGRRRHR